MIEIFFDYGKSNMTEFFLMKFFAKVLKVIVTFDSRT